MNRIITYIAIVAACYAPSVLALDSEELITTNGARIMIGDEEPVSILLENKQCMFLAEATSSTVKKVNLNLVSVTCGLVTKDVLPDDNVKVIEVTKVDVLKSGLVVGVINELRPGTVIHASEWLTYQFASAE
jgi:hypothetical protein